MSHPCSFIKVTYTCFKFVSIKFVANVRTFHFVSSFNLKARENFFSRVFYQTLSSKRRKKIVKTHDTSRKIFTLSEMSFCTSTDAGSSSASQELTGTSVYFPFWVSQYTINLKEVCPVTSNRNTQKRIYIEKLRKYDIVSEGKEYTTMNNEPVVKLKVLNYNILSQVLLNRHHYLYRKQKPYMLAWNYRKELILKDITTIDPDIFCLQEVEEGQLPYFFKDLETLGYKSIHKMKTSHKGDGLSIYYKYPSIKLKENFSVEFSQPGIIELESRDQVGLIAKFEKNGKVFYVANTHLLYNPKRTEVRLAQLQLFLAELHRITGNEKGRQSRILLMGDFNSTPESPVIKFLIEGQLNSEFKPLPSCLGISSETIHMDKTTKLYHTDNKEYSPSDDSRSYSIRPENDGTRHLISHPFKFSSAYVLSDDEHRGVTTFQENWVMVDYIFYTDTIELVARLNLPTPADCNEKVHFLPNKFFPSDHLPLAAEFEIP